MSVKRYDLEYLAEDSDRLGMVERTDGDYILASDHAEEVAKLEAKCDGLLNRCHAAENWVALWGARRAEYVLQINALTRAVRAWKWHDELSDACMLDDPCSPAWGESYGTLRAAMARALEVIDD